jgi:hypothetical protein
MENWKRGTVNGNVETIKPCSNLPLCDKTFTIMKQLLSVSPANRMTMDDV